MLSRSDRVQEAVRKIVPPFTLDETLTFFCPQENLDALEHPLVRSLHHHMLVEYTPPVQGKRVVMLILPCTKVKPYALSVEHLAINTYLLGLGFEPRAPAEYPPLLEKALPPGGNPQVLNNGLWARENLFLHRYVVSEPMGLVPYEYIYFFQGRPSLAARYDDPGLFEHRGTAVCPWRADYTGIPWGRKYRWGDREKEAYVQVHNRLVELLVGILDKIGDLYVARLAYVSPQMTHRSFLSSVEEKRQVGLPLGRRTRSGLLRLHGVNDLRPGRVRIVPSAQEIVAIQDRLARRLPGRTRRQICGYFATGGRGASPLTLPETLEVLGEHLRRLG